MTTDSTLPPGYRERPQAYWQFRNTLPRAREVSTVLADLRERVAAGEPLPQQVALALLDEVIAQREPHLTGRTYERFAVDETITTCAGCGKQVMQVWRGPGAEPQHDPGVCSDINDWDFALRTALGLPTPDLDEHYALARAAATDPKEH